jgi:DNA-binding beta-propeller fold protein YncE
VEVRGILQYRRSIRSIIWFVAVTGILTPAIVAGSSTGSVASAAAPVPARATEFDAPSGLAFGGGHLWVTNRAGNSVTEINPATGAWIKTVRGSGYGFNRPTAIVSLGPDLFVTNQAGSVSELRANDGAPIRSISGSEFGFVDPIAIAATGHTLLVLNAGGASAAPATAGSISELDAVTGKFIRRVVGASFAFDEPSALTVSGPDVFVADEGNNSVTEVTVAGGKLVP